MGQNEARTGLTANKAHPHLGLGTCSCLYGGNGVAGRASVGSTGCPMCCLPRDGDSLTLLPDSPGLSLF